MSRFKDAEFMTAREKDLVLACWEAFLKSGCSKDKFANRLYEHLHQNCSFIAHYERGVFYAEYFSEPEDTIRFLSQWDFKKTGCRSIEYGETYWIHDGNDVVSEYYDINLAMVEVAEKYLPALYKKLGNSQVVLDMARIKLLAQKHELTVEIKGEKAEAVLAGKQKRLV